MNVTFSVDWRNWFFGFGVDAEKPARFGLRFGPLGFHVRA